MQEMVQAKASYSRGRLETTRHRIERLKSAIDEDKACIDKAQEDFVEAIKADPIRMKKHEKLRLLFLL